ncbi:MAG: hypothetical protein ACK5L5_07500, partial [Bacteroidales bacterium]
MENSFPLTEKGRVADIYIDKDDYEVVKISSGLFAEDIHRVTGKKGRVSTSTNIKSKTAVIVGTLG